MSKTVSKLLVFGALVGALIAGGATVPAFADTPEHPKVQAAWTWSGEGRLKARDGIDLGVAKLTKNGMLKSDLLEESGTPRGMRVEWQSTHASAKVAYPISMYGQPTEYWLQTHIYTAGSALTAYAECEIFEGQPGAAGAEEPTWSSPFQCETTRRGIDNDWDFSVDAASGVAEVSGLIQVNEWISLGEGTFHPETMSFGKYPDPVVRTFGETSFDYVLRQHDHAGKRADAAFSYRLFKDGVATPYVVYGSARSDGEQKCGIVPADGPYKCTVSGAAMSTVHWNSSFEISEK